MSEKTPVVLEIHVQTQDIIFLIVHPETGEIVPKYRSINWLLKRLFMSELKTWKRRWPLYADLHATDLRIIDHREDATDE